METVKIEFKGYVDVDVEDICLLTPDYNQIPKAEVRKLTAKQVVEGLQDGQYILEFISSYVEAINGEESYAYSVHLN